MMLLGVGILLVLSVEKICLCVGKLSVVGVVQWFVITMRTLWMINGIAKDVGYSTMSVTTEEVQKMLKDLRQLQQERQRKITELELLLETLQEKYEVAGITAAKKLLADLKHSRGNVRQKIQVLADKLYNVMGLTE